MDKEKEHKFTVRPFGDIESQHFTLITNNETDEYYAFYFAFLDEDGVTTEGTDLGFLLSIMDFLDVDYHIEDCDEDLFNVKNYVTKSKETFSDWIDDAVSERFFDFSKAQDDK